MTEFHKNWRNLTLAGARQVRDSALRAAIHSGVAISTVVVDRTGRILLMETDDEARPGAPEASIMKARGAARYGVATHATAQYLQTIPAQLAQHALSLPESCALHGGVPIRFHGELLGAVGVSGGSGEQDVAIALAAAESLQ